MQSLDLIAVVRRLSAGVKKNDAKRTARFINDFELVNGSSIELAQVTVVHLIRMRSGIREGDIGNSAK